MKTSSVTIEKKNEERKQYRSIWSLKKQVRNEEKWYCIRYEVETEKKLVATIGDRAHIHWNRIQAKSFFLFLHMVIPAINY